MDPEPQSGDASSPIGALISLLVDESKTTQVAAIKALEGLGPDAMAALQTATLDDDPKLRARARRAIAAISRHRGQKTLSEILAEDRGDRRNGTPGDDLLIRGLLAIDDILGFRHAAPGEAGPARSAAEMSLNQWTQELDASPSWREGPTIAAAGALRRVLAEDAGLKGPEHDYHNLQHVSLSRTVASMTGLPLTLSAIYATVARRNGLEAHLLPFPSQVLLALGPASDRLILDSSRGGGLVSRATCEARLKRIGAPVVPEWLAPADDRTMLVRQMRNLVAAMLRHDRRRDARIFTHLIEEAV